MLFLPGTAGALMMSLCTLHHPILLVVNFLWLLNIFILVAVQFYLTTLFQNVVGRSSLLTANSTLVLAFWSFYLIYVAYTSLTVPEPLSADSGFRPVRIDYSNPVVFIVAIMLWYSAINFFLINNWIVSNKIKKIEDAGQQAALTGQFLAPMRRLVRTTLILLMLAFIFTFVSDVYRLFFA